MVTSRTPSKMAATTLIPKTATNMIIRIISSHSHTTSTGLFNNPLLKSPQGFQTLTDSTIESSEQLARDILCSKDSIDTLKLFDELSDTLCKAADLSECVRMLHPKEEYVRAAEACCMELGAVVERLNTDTQLYHSLERIDQSQLDEVSARHADSLLHDFEISGIHLDEGKRKEVVRLNQMILSLSHTFMYQCNEPYCIELNGAPRVIKDNLNLFHHDKDYVYITNAVHMHQDESLRKHTYSCYHSFNHPNADTLDQLLTARHQLAALSGYETFAHRALQDTMAGSPQRVMEFLDKLNELIMPLAEDEVKEMSLIKGGQVYPWDYTWMFHKVKSTLINSSDARELQKYFSIESCINGLCKLFQELFGVKMVVSQTLPGETWDDSITKFSFLQGEAILGHLYVDWYDRTNKTASDCQFTIQGGRQMLLNNNDVSYQLPISALSLSLGYDHHLPSQSVYNLFHEMGHAIHSMLGRSPYQNTSGTRCPTDYAETPSNLMELFLQDTRVLKSFARHSKSNQPISTKLARLFSWSSNLYPAFTAQQQILYSVMDQVFHGPHPLNQSTLETFVQLHETYSPVKHIPKTAWYLRFSHLYMYAGKYYSYLWARAVANLIWKKLFNEDPFNRCKGDIYHHNMLAYGGGIHPLKLVKNVLGYEPSIDELVDAYYQEIVYIKNQQQYHNN